MQRRRQRGCRRRVFVLCSKLAANSGANVLVFPSCLWLNGSVTPNSTETCVFCYWCSQPVLLRRSLAPPPSRTQAARKRGGDKKTGSKKTSGALITGLSSSVCAVSLGLLVPSSSSAGWEAERAAVWLVYPGVWKPGCAN